MIPFDQREFSLFLIRRNMTVWPGDFDVYRSKNMSRQAALSSGSASDGGQRIGDYVLGKTIGSGSFGKVKKGVHSSSGVTVAIKIINKEKISAKKMDHKVRREIFNLKRFRHPHIIKLYQVMETDRDIFLVMEYIQGGELFDYIVQRGKLAEAEARAYYQQMMSAVAYCHSLHVVHRDLKPENLLCASLPTQAHPSAFSPLAQYSIKIADFGLSNIVQDGEFLKTSCGSPNYAAPEVIEGKYYSGEEVDVWSSGVILYALLTARLPFDDDYIPHLFQKIKKGKFKIPSYLSAACQDLIRQLLIVDPLNRITVSEIVQHPWFTVNLPPYLQPYCALAFTNEEANAFGDASLTLSTGTTRWDERVLHDLQARCPDSWGKLSIQDLICQLDKEDEIQQQELLASGADVGSATTPLLVSYYLLFDASGLGDRFDSMPHEGFMSDTKKTDDALDPTALAVAALSTSPPLNMRDNQLLLSPLHRADGMSASPSGQTPGASWWSSWSLLSGPASATNSLKPNVDNAQQQQYWSLGLPPSSFQRSNQRVAAFSLSLQPPQIMTEVCRVLKQFQFEWKAVTPYQLRCRTPNPRFRPDVAPMSTGSSSGSANSLLSASNNSSWIKIGIQLFKMSPQPPSATSRPSASSSCLLDFKLISGDVLIVLQYCVQIMNELTAT